MRGIGDRIGLARFIGIGFAAVTLLFASGNHLGATDGGLLDDADELTRLSRTEVARLRADARPIGAIADDDLSLTAALVTANRPAGEALSKGSMIVVDIEHTLPADEIEDVVRTAGGRVYNHISESLLEAFVPASEVGQLQAQPAIGFVQSPPTPVELVDLAGSVSGESAAKANAPAWHSAGYRGNGVAVGIIDSFHGSAWDPAAAAGNVPLPASVFCRIGGSVCDLWSVSPGAQHGTAVAEVIHDMAPAAALHLADAYTPGDYIAAIDHFAAQGVRVINHSRSWSFDGPGDGTGAAAGIVNYAASRGILWVNAAGNLGDGGYWRGAWADGNGNNWLNFTSTDEVMGFICHPGLGLRWDDWATSGRTDYDIYIWDNASDVGDPLLAKASSVADQTAGAAPIEDWGSSILGAGCSGSADVDYLAINAFSPGAGTSGDVLEIGVVALGEYWSAAHSAAIPFADSYSAAMVAVGAVDPPTGSFGRLLQLARPDQ